jgi:hypothetical protein
MSVINFSDDSAMFLLLNIITHDPIHDYNDYNSERWAKCKKTLQKIGELIGGSKGSSTTTKIGVAHSSNNVDKHVSNIKVASNVSVPFSGKYRRVTGSKNGKSKLIQEHYSNNLIIPFFLEEYFEHIKNQVILNAMNFIFFNKIIKGASLPIPVSDILLICYYDSYVIDDPEVSFEKPSKDSPDPPDPLDSSLIYETVVNTEAKKVQSKIMELVAKDFYIFVKYCLLIDNFKDMFHLIECLNNYLLTERIIITVDDSIKTGHFAIPQNNEPDDESESVTSDADDDSIEMDENDDSTEMDENDEDDLVLEDVEDEQMDTIGGKLKKYKMNGGAIQLLPRNNQEFINEINAYWLTLAQDEVFIKFANDDYILSYGNYETKRSEIIEGVIGICNNNGINGINEKKYLKNNMERLFPQQLKRAPRQSSNLPDRIKEAVFFSTIDTQKKMKEQEVEQEKEAKKAEKDAAAAENGDLTSEEKKRVDNFMKFIARFGLWAMNICNIEGNTIVNPSNNQLLEKEIDCLKAIAEWTPLLKNKDLDTRLITNFYNFYNSNNSLITEENAKLNINQRYIINNAAPMGDLQRKVFCPTSSIVDAMTSTCTWNMANSDGIEAGNVDYTIAGTKAQYQGKITFINNPSSTIPNGSIFPGTNNYDYIQSTLIATLANGIVIEGNKIINVPNAVELKAHVALKNTMIVVIEKMYSLTNPASGGRIDYFSDGKIWNTLFLYGANEPNNQFFKNLFAELLFKGRGDLDQEINAAIKNGAYQGSISYPKKINISNFDKDSGHAVRYFAANDRPSACRFMYMLKNAPDNMVNKKAFGGYFSNNKKVLVNRGQIAFIGGINRRISKKKKHSNIRVTTRHVVKNTKKTRKNVSRKKRNSRKH